MVHQTWKFTIKGRVQGVNFRRTVRKHAQEIGLTGWVKNEEDGSVTILAQGLTHMLKTFESWINHSPGFSQVTASHREIHKENVLHGFEIVRTKNFIKDHLSAWNNLRKKL